MVGYRWHARRYFAWEKKEWLSVLATSAAGGFVFTRSFFYQPGAAYSLLLAVKDYLVNFTEAFLIITFLVVMFKLAGIRFGFQVVYEHYTLGLLLGVFVAFLSFGYLPFIVTGRLNYRVIHNLRIGKFRATMGKNWEMGLTAAAGPLALILLTVPLNALLFSTGFVFFRGLIVRCVLFTVYTLLPLPLIQTANPYTVYMSRLESLEGNLPGLDLFIASRTWFFFAAGMVIIFSIFALLFHPSLLLLILSILLGFGTMFLYAKARLHFA